MWDEYRDNLLKGTPDYYQAIGDDFQFKLTGVTGAELQKYADGPGPIPHQLVRYRVLAYSKVDPKSGKAAPLPVTKAPEGNGPLSEADRRGKPLYNTGTPEADKQLKESAARQDQAVRRFQSSGAEGNGPISGEGLLGKPLYNTGTPEAERQLKESAALQAQSVSKFKKSGAPGNGPVTAEGMLGKPVEKTGKP